MGPHPLALLGLLAFLQIALRIENDAASDGAIGAGVAGLDRVGEFEGADRNGMRIFDL